MARRCLPPERGAVFAHRMAIRFKAVRTWRGMTQQSWAELAGVQRSVITDVESMTKSCQFVGILVIWALADAAGVTIDELLGRAPWEPKLEYFVPAAQIRGPKDDKA